MSSHRFITLKPKYLLPLVVGLSLSTSSMAQIACPGDFTQVDFNFSGNVETFVIPADTDTIIARASGAGGGSSANAAGGMGSAVEGTFSVNGGDILQIMVGGTGSQGSSNDGDAAGGGGGGASLVAVGADLATANALLVAGGGGGAGSPIGAVGGDGGIPGEQTVLSNDVAGTAGGSAGGNGGAGDLDPMADGEAGAAGGPEGEGGSATMCASAGAGLNTDGQSIDGNSTAAVALIGGGDGSSNLLFTNSLGGFGGGGAPSGCGGGGGGYSGGGAGGAGDLLPDSQGGAGGGGSLNMGMNPNNPGPSINADNDGLVEICYNTVQAPPPAPVPLAVPTLTPAGFALFVLALLGIAAWRWPKAHD